MGTSALTLTYVNSALETAYLVRNQSVSLLIDGGGFKLGLSENEEYKTATIQLHTGDIIVLSTDGYFDMTNVDLKRSLTTPYVKTKYGYRRLEIFLTQKGWDSAEQLKTELVTEIRAFQGNTPQDDDIAMLVMKV